MQDLLSRLRAALAAAGDPQNVAGAKRFFREPIDTYGLRAADTRALATAFGKELKGQSKESVFTLCEDLFRSGKMEEGHIAAAWAWSRRREFSETDGDRFERWIDRYVTNWAVCDNFCNKAVGALFTRFPALLPRTEAWALSPNRWMRRAAAVSLIAPARKGFFPEESFRVADLLLTDADDLVQKGYGWLLKEQCKKNEAAVYAFVEARKDRMPRTALRYAIEKMSPGDRKSLMER
ncbi:MAG: DNA alkylation repair protein [Chitinophagaceae bacterium]|nr:MAG: DNA alkylation repair protein [Chitinophagaceae bacterium]